MGFNWIDIVLVVILIVATILGMMKGLIRQVIGILALIIGFILALVYYSYAAEIFRSLISNNALSQFLGFITIFLVVLCIGALVSAALSKMMRGSFKFFNHVLGAGFGLLKGILICGVVVFAMLVFPVNTNAMKNSQLAPLCLKMTKAIVSLIPQELKEKFNEAYQEIVGRRGRDEKRI